MSRILIVGADTLAGRALATQFSKHNDVTALWFQSGQEVACDTSSRMTQASLTTELEHTDVVMFCGDAAKSSWDERFGQFTAERRWLPQCAKAATTLDRKLVYVSSDAVLCGPWVFHDDHCQSLATDTTAKSLLKYESLVASVPGSLIVRTNVVGRGSGTFLKKTLDRLAGQRSVLADASTFATPIGGCDFAEAVTRCLSHDLSGVVNVGGAERVSPYGLVLALAGLLDVGADRLQPTPHTGATAERAMRCARLRAEVQWQAPLLRDSLESLVDAVSAEHELAVAA